MTVVLSGATSDMFLLTLSIKQFLFSERFNS